MSIVLNEKNWAADMINKHSLGKKPYEAACRVAKYYISEGYSKREARKLLDNYVLQCEPGASLVEWSSLLDNAMKVAVRYKPVEIPFIPITEKEMNAIGKLQGKQLQRLAFTLLCLSKYWDCISASNNHWVNCSDSEIMQMANIGTSIRRQSQLFAQLRDAGLIGFSKKVDNLNVQVLFADDGPEIHQITDFRNLGYQYLKFIGGAYFECANCGITTKIAKSSEDDKKSQRGRRQKYCKSCATEVYLQQTVNSVIRRRMKNRVV